MSNKLFAEERREKIKDILNNKGKVIVKNLSKQFDVTADCIRKDLKKLENEGVLKRTYGGGVPTRKIPTDRKVEERIDSHREAKNKIAKKAFNLIDDNETIFLDISTINILLAQLIDQSNKKITVITNMTDIITTLSSNPNVTIICPGGKFNPELDGFIGSMTIEEISDYKPSKAFIGSVGVNAFEKEVTTFNTEDGNTKKAIINSAKKSFIVIENIKFELDGFYKFSNLEDINGIITEKKPGSNICDALLEINTKII
ncbi:DeoR/GlpR family DNA-binding transcription regulator [Halanaerocella petrolearia]